jgi:hypothetical protein
MERFIQIDIFGLSVLIENKLGQQAMYTIEPVGVLYQCFVQKRITKKGRWKNKRLIESSRKYIRFEYAENEAGFKIERN